MIKGEKGCAKSTAARGLARLLPPLKVRCNAETGAMDPYNRGPSSADDNVAILQTPFVDLPIGATEDRVLGSVDFSATLQKGGQRVFAPGLLQAANRGILYIDEVNLLPSYLVDILLDAAAMGVSGVAVFLEHHHAVRVLAPAKGIVSAGRDVFGEAFVRENFTAKQAALPFQQVSRGRIHRARAGGDAHVGIRGAHHRLVIAGG